VVGQTYGIGMADRCESSVLAYPIAIGALPVVDETPPAVGCETIG